jgi:trigger factor
MSSGDEHDASVFVTEELEQEQRADGQVAETKRKLEIDVQISDVGPCRKHLKVTVPRSEIEHQFGESLGSFQRDAHVPGFRPGHAPRQLVEKRYRKEVAGQVKSALLMASLEQIDANYNLNPITQPKLDLEAIKLPDEGPMIFEMDVEVRPEFQVGEYRGLKVKRPVKTIRERDVEAQYQQVLERHAQVVPKLEGAARIGDYLTADLIFFRPDHSPLGELKEVTFRLQQELRIQDGHIPDIGSALEGINIGESREVQARLGTAVGDPALRGQFVPVKVQVHDLKQLRLPEVNQEFLASLGFDSIHDLREAVRDQLGRRYEAQQKQAVRRQILDALIAATPFDLPSDLVKRQEKSTLDRMVMELRNEGFSDNDIKATLEHLRADHRAMLDSQEEFERNLASFLTPTQRAKLLLGFAGHHRPMRGEGRDKGGEGPGDGSGPDD